MSEAWYFLSIPLALIWCCACMYGIGLMLDYGDRGSSAFFLMFYPLTVAAVVVMAFGAFIIGGFPEWAGDSNEQKEEKP